MAKYYVYCEKHGIIGDKYTNSNDAYAKREEHLLNVNPPHGKVDVIEEYSQEKYGQLLTYVRKFKR